jgi:hypothetical protein
MLERGKACVGCALVPGDEINHKPDQNADFPLGYKYDYCNPDVLLKPFEGGGWMLVTPEGIPLPVVVAAGCAKNASRNA